MNARQKAKYYKRKYEELANAPVPIFHVHDHPVDTLKVQRLYPEALVFHSESYVKDVVVRDLAQCIAEDLNRYAEYFTEFEPHLNKYKITAQVRVVRP